MNCFEYLEETFNEHPVYCSCGLCLEYADAMYERKRTMNWKYLELVNSAHNKFWMISRNEDGKGFVARWGKIGTTGQMQIKNFSSVAQTVKAFNDKVWEKGKKNYVLKHYGDQFLTAEGANMYRSGMPITELMMHFRRRDPIAHDPNSNVIKRLKREEALKKKVSISKVKPKFKIRIKKRKTE